MLVELNAFAAQLSNLFRDHPALSALATVLVWLFGLALRYTIDLEITERRKENRKAKRDAAALALAKAEAAQLLLNCDSAQFKVGRVIASVQLVDYSLRGYPSTSFMTRRVARTDAIPTEYAEAYATQLQVFRQKLEQKEIFEGVPKVAPVRIVLDRSEGDESKSLYFEYTVSPGYVHQRAATAVFQSLPLQVRQGACPEFCVRGIA